MPLTGLLLIEWIARGNDERFEIAFNQVGWERCGAFVYEPFTERWLREIPTPIFIRATAGHKGKGICDEARGFALPQGFTSSLAHGSMLAYVDSIAANGLMNGGIGGNRANKQFSACDWRGLPDEAVDYSAQFDGPERVPDRSKEKRDAIYLFNYEIIREMGLDPRMCRKRSVTTESGETVPPECLEAVFC